jgi:hypothetical protein
MATGGEARQKGVEELGQEVTCPVCQDHFQEPKILPCLHYYCKGCIEALAKRAGGSNQSFPCPECRTPTLLPQGSPDQLQTAFFINRMKEVHAKLEKVEGKVEAKCEMCSGGVATTFCRQCAEFICNECTRSHQRMKVFAGHKVSTLQELKEGGAKTIIAAKSAPPQICKVHDEQAKIYCYDCKTLVCRDCVVKVHRDHEYEFVKIAAPETKKKLMEHLTPLGEIQAGIQGAVRNVEGAKAGIIAMDESMTTSIKQSFQELRDILDKREKELLAETAATVEKKMTNLTVQQKKLEMSSGTIQSLVEFVERSVENATDEELMTIHTQMMTRISEETEKQQRANTELAPVEKADKVVSIELAGDLKKQCQENASIVSLPMTIAVEDPKAIHVVGQRSQLVFRLTSQDGRSVICKSPSVKAVIKSKVDGSCIEAGVVCPKQGTYQIEFTPTVRGRHHLEVMMCNVVPVLREPVQIFVKIPPTMLGQPVRSFHVRGNAKFVSANLSEEILITAGKKIVVFDQSGKNLYSISNEKLTAPQGVAVRESGIFVVDRGSHTLLKIDKTGKLLKSVGGGIGSGKGQFCNPNGLTVVGDEVIVCDGGNHRLQVFTSDLEFVRQFGSYGTGNGRFMAPVDVAHDKDGKNLYVSDYTRDCVQVFTMQGQYLRYLVAKGDITNPTGIASDGELVYIIQLNGLLHIYRKNGDKVCSFPTKSGSAVRGVAVDQDGFIYVCDYNSSQVIVF